MRLYEIEISLQKKLLDEITHWVYSNTFYDIYVLTQNKTNDFTLPINRLYDDEEIINMQQLLDSYMVFYDIYPENAQILVMLVEMLEYFSG